ncbi:hypothetical protein SAMD00019534_118200 [Acytostelium subglobosum LB1]|uniref:hypothetical protein n=1 Tax=Acytostelium subglobosum LB1 TaxID=1410327 RepID=UPI000644F1A3|nr:hypothetical protein SAMD00019534_118200 [Acytostelium subglobosum LB1]GAM28644.1 hypothetical protein SAMD00019534_118200 [Acytostelium subglobosum LB1]|eukprot:XP_012748422.1 hypothetical protein SAMD00019534_118200 [Acytostelium subglobosum LB1]
MHLESMNTTGDFPASLDLRLSSGGGSSSGKSNTRPTTSTATTTTTTMGRTQSNEPPKKPNIGKLPPSSTNIHVHKVFDRVKDFLPKMKEANEQLEKQIKEQQADVNIENVKEGQEYIEMNLALGILEKKENLTEDNMVIPTSSSTTATSSTSSPLSSQSKNKNKKKNNNNNMDTVGTSNSNFIDVNIKSGSIMDQLSSILDNGDDSDDEHENEPLEPVNEY